MLSSAINIEEPVKDLIKIICFETNMIRLHKDHGILDTSEVPEFTKHHGLIRNHCKGSLKDTKQTYETNCRCK